MQSEVRTHKVLVSPDGREKVDLFGPHDRLYGFRMWRRDGEAWQLAVENRENDGDLAQFSRLAGKLNGWVAHLLRIAIGG